MSNRFHNKYHRHSHHTAPRTNEPDSALDPIASPSDPFTGTFVLSGQLSAMQNVIVDNNIYANIVISTQISATSAVFDIIDVIMSEVSGFNIVGNSDVLTVPDTVTPGYDLLLLSGVGLTGTNWASFVGDIKCRNFATIGCISADCIDSYTQNTPISVWSNIDMNGYSISGIGNDSLAFQSGLRIHSADDASKIKINSYSYAESITTGTSAFGENSHAEGGGTTASGVNSHAEGNQTQATGDGSHAEGNQTQATGDSGSHAEGNSTHATGQCSHAEGEDVIASGAASHAEGGSTNAVGNYSHAEGSSTHAIGTNSHAAGVGAYAAHDESFVWSSYSTFVSSTSSDTFTVSAENGVILGNISQFDFGPQMHTTPTSPATASGEFLTVNVAGTGFGLLLWNLP